MNTMTLLMVSLMLCAVLASGATASAAPAAPDPIATLYARLTPQGRAKLGVPLEQLRPDGHELAHTFLKPLAEKGPFSAEVIRTNTTEKLQNQRTRAAQLLEHKVELLGGYGLQDMGTPVNWFQAPQGDWQWPTHLSRHYYLLPLAYVYRATGEARYAEEAVSWLLDWVSKFPIGAESLNNTAGSWSLRYAENKNPTTREGTFKGYVDGPWTALSAHARVEYWTQLFQLIHDAPVMTNRNVAILLNSLVGDHRQIMLDFPRQMNQFQGVASSLIELGFYYPDFEGVAEAEQVGWQRLAFHTTREIYPDGSMAEASPNYDMGMVQRLNELVKKGRERGRTLPAVLEERVRAATRYFALSSDPLGRSPRIAKGGGSVRDPLRRLNHEASDPEVAFVASGGKEGRAPAQLSHSFPWAGHHAFRSGWDEDATWLFFDAGPRGTGHHDIAQLGVQLLSRGEWLLCDPGYYSYSGEGEAGQFAAYFKSTAAHNAALVDGQGQISYAPGVPVEPNAQAGDYRWTEAAGSVAAQGVYTYGFGPGGAIKVSQRRRVTFLPTENAFEIEDTFEGAGRHDIALHWQLAPGTQIQMGANTVSVQRPRAHMQMSFESPAELRFSSVIGQKEPLLGWFSQTYGKLEPAPTLRAETSAMLPLTITTRLVITPAN